MQASDPVTALILALAAKFPWFMPALAIYVLLAPVLVRLAKKDQTTWGKMILSSSADLWGVVLHATAPSPAPAAAPAVAADAAPAPVLDDMSKTSANPTRAE